MRKSLIVFLVLLFCAVLMLSSTLTAVSAGQDDITVTETTLTGDVSAAEGLLIETFLNMERQLFWHSACKAGSQPEITTEFRFTHSPQSTQREETDPRIYFSAGTGGFGISGVVTQDMEQERGFMLKPVFDLAAEMGPGEERTEIVQLNRYYDMLQVELSMSSFGTHDWQNVRNSQEAFLQEYFNIPIPDGLRWEVYVRKDAAGQIVEVNCGDYYPPDQKEWYSLYAYSDCVYLDDTIYLLPNGNADFSQCKGGYGIFRIPIGYVDQWDGRAYNEPVPHMYVEEIENLYPLDPDESERLSLMKSPAGELLLFRQQNGKTELQIIDPSDMTVRQELLLDFEARPDLWYHEDLLVLVDQNRFEENSRIKVYIKQNGDYILWMEDTLYPLNDEGYYSEPEIAFDGNRLAIVSQLEYYTTASSRVLIYERDGLTYAGDYLYSCDTLPPQRTMETYNWVDPLQISWQ